MKIPSRTPDVFLKHQLRIARDTGASIMGGMTKEEARELLRRHGRPLPPEDSIRENPHRMTEPELSGDVERGGTVILRHAASGRSVPFRYDGRQEFPGRGFLEQYTALQEGPDVIPHSTTYGVTLLKKGYRKER